MRIGMLVDAYKPYISGVTNVIDLTKRYLESVGEEVFVFTFGDMEYEDHEANVIRSPGISLNVPGFYLNVRYSRRASRLLHTMDVVHVHHPFLSGRLATWHCKPRGIPIVFTNHTRYDLYTQAYLPMLPEGVGDLFMKTFIPGFCNAIDRVIAPSAGLKEILKRAGVTNRIDVVPNGVDLSRFRQDIAPIPRAQIGFRDTDILLVYTGRAAPEKNLFFLLRAFNGAAQAYPDIRLLLVGGGPELDNLKDWVKHMGIADRVQFTGQVEYDRVSRYLVTADAFVTASVTEVHPLTVIEAMAAGLPVLGIESPGVGDTITDGLDGFLIPEEDLAAFTAKMVRLATDDDLRRRMGEQARRTSEQYSYERTSQQVLEIYRDVIAGNPGRRGLRARWIRLWDRWR